MTKDFDWQWNLIGWARLRILNRSKHNTTCQCFRRS